MILLDHLAGWERQEYLAALDEALAACGGAPDPGAVDALAGALDGAARAGRAWADAVRDRLVRDDLRGHLKTRAKAAAVALVAYDGRVVARTVRVGVRRRAAAGPAHWQQALLEDLTWAELADFLAMVRSQIGSLLVNQAMAGRLLALRADHPGTRGPAQACAALGTTVEAFLATGAVS